MFGILRSITSWAVNQPAEEVKILRTKNIRSIEPSYMMVRGARRDAGALVVVLQGGLSLCARQAQYNNVWNG